MKNFKHTPGPWTALDTKKLIQADSGPYVALILAEDYVVEGQVGQTYGSKNSVSMANANATLISLAPDLLQKLVEFNDVLENADVSPGKTSVDLNETKKEIKDLLKKLGG